VLRSSKAIVQLGFVQILLGYLIVLSPTGDKMNDRVATVAMDMVEKTTLLTRLYLYFLA
jgi:hypothetical protein